MQQLPYYNNAVRPRVRDFASVSPVPTCLHAAEAETIPSHVADLKYTMWISETVGLPLFLQTY